MGQPIVPADDDRPAARKSVAHVAGLAAATTVSAALNVVSLGLCMRVRMQGLRLRRLGGSIAGTVAATIALCVVGGLTLAAMQPFGNPLHSPVFALLLLAVTTATGLAAFVASAHALRMPELRSVGRLTVRMATAIAHR